MSSRGRWLFGVTVVLAMVLCSPSGSMYRLQAAQSGSNSGAGIIIQTA